MRGDGVTTSQPLTALYHVRTDRALAARLIPLLRHPAFVPRVYVAMTLGKLHATEALPEMLAIVREGYAFSDAVALASGKHFDQSQTVRWRGFLCMALGRMGGDDARLALEQFATDAQQPRDIRYSSVVGLGFIASPNRCRRCARWPPTTSSGWCAMKPGAPRRTLNYARGRLSHEESSIRRPAGMLRQPASQRCDSARFGGGRPGEVGCVIFLATSRYCRRPASET